MRRDPIRAARRRQHEVARLQVPVHHAALVRGLDCRRNLDAEPERFAERQRTARGPRRARSMRGPGSGTTAGFWSPGV
jgi:hypothetical protein